MLLLHDFFRYLHLVGWRLPGHIGDLRFGTKIRGRVTMTIQAPAHAQRLFLLNHVHCGDIAMAGRTAHSGPEMHCMSEISIIGKLMYPDPFDRQILRPALPDRKQSVVIDSDDPMAVHTDLGGGNIGDRREFYIEVAIATIQTKIAGMQPVAVVHGLDGAIADICIFRRTIVPEKSNRSQYQDNYGN